MTKTFKERCSEEATAYPIFLFQRRILNMVEVPYGWEYEDDGIVMTDGDADESTEEERQQFEHSKQCRDFEKNDGVPYISCFELFKRNPDFFVEMWYTERVFLSREEATRFGEAKSYNYVQGWRVFSVPAHGKLQELIQVDSE